MKGELWLGGMTSSANNDRPEYFMTDQCIFILWDEINNLQQKVDNNLSVAWQSNSNFRSSIYWLTLSQETAQYLHRKILLDSFFCILSETAFTMFCTFAPQLFQVAVCKFLPVPLFLAFSSLATARRDGILCNAIASKTWLVRLLMWNWEYKKRKWSYC